jgi:hypothetical protein
MAASARSLVRSIMHGPVARAALTGIAALLALPALEIGYRLHSHRPALELEDWRAGRIEDIRFGEFGRFDADLGWAPKDWLQSIGYNTLDHGIRRNFNEEDVRTGGILAVGDVFTNGGIEMADHETWPAYLEQLIGAPVLNAGVVGYATDQIILRAERLLPVVKPGTLVVGVYEETIERARYASYGAPKPYFTIDGGKLVHHALTRLPEVPHPDWPSRVRTALGYSAVLDVVLSHTAPVYWLGNAGEQVLRTVDNDPVAVTCGLLQRLKTRAEAQGVRVLLLLQHARKTVAESPEPGADVRQVAACATAAGLEAIDQLDPLRTAIAQSAADLDELYLQTSGFGQMSPKGNRATADLLAGALGKVAALGK